MLVVGFPTGSFQANCYLVAAGAGEPCVIVDPGQDAVEPIADAVRQHRLSPVAVLLTHGHFDHAFSVAPVCDGNDIPAWIHPDDRELLADPMKGFGAMSSAFFGGRLTMREPNEVRALADGVPVELAGLTFDVLHSPGHTPGSVMFESTVDSGAGLLFAGDVLFAGAIGRTDLPGGDSARMVRSLREKVLPLADDTVVLPGHGPSTTIGNERENNPFLLGIRDATIDQLPQPHRGL
ncbi:MAG: MBL fold metallo-hydrolase [Sciscionella sp.]|nr:MBL fold metallo-hydrolase [Sciscionella sp.]